MPTQQSDPASEPGEDTDDQASTDARPDADPAVLQRELAAARKEAAKYRTEARRLQQAVEAATEAEKSELQKVMDRAEAAEKARDAAIAAQRDSLLVQAAQTEAIRLGFRRPERAVREIDRDALIFDDAGSPTNLVVLLEAELKTRPELKASAPVPPDAGAGTRGKSQLTLEQIRSKSPEWIADHIVEVDEAVEAITAGR